MYKKDGFITPSEHVNFLAKNLFGACGQIVNGAIAYLAPDGGGPAHAHHPPLPTTCSSSRREKPKCCWTDKSESSAKTKRSSSKGGIPHSVWNNAQAETVMIGITLKNNENGK